jgi:hypothetical protein
VKGSATGTMPTLAMTLVDVVPKGQKMDTRADNGKLDGKAGPIKSEIDFNLKDQYLTPKFKGMDLKLIKGVNGEKFEADTK